MSAPSPPFSSRVGSRSGSAIPKAASEGPIPRRRMRLFPLPSTMKPAMRTLSPASTRIRVEMLARWQSGVGVAEGVAAGVTAALGFGDAVAVAAGGAVAVAVAVAPGVAVAVAVGVALGVGETWGAVATNT